MSGLTPSPNVRTQVAKAVELFEVVGSIGGTRQYFSGRLNHVADGRLVRGGNHK
jgi:hypothetical protein